MNSLPVGLQILVWAYFLAASAALAGCVGLVVVGLARPRHRRPADPVAAMRTLGRAVEKVWRDLVDGFASGAEWLIYGARS